MSSASTPNRSPQPNGGVPRIPLTRTVAIIKAHAVKHRLTIERSIVDAGFEIVKERQMAFDPENDRDILYDLFGRDADSLGDDPVWVYVLERRRAVEVWLTLMGPDDPQVARVEQPNSLRAVYGVDPLDNAFAGSPDPTTAEQQISTLFASSPPFPTVDEGGDDVDADPMTLSPPSRPANGSRNYDSVRSMQSLGSRHSSTSSRAGQANTNGNGSAFKARPMPSSTGAPDIAPRLTRAASLRLGLSTDDGRRPVVRTPRSRAEQQAAFDGVPGHKRRETISVASTAAPTIAPRATKASALREQKDQLARTPTWGNAKKDAVPTNDRPKAGVANYENVPGHRRRESIAVASTAAPTVAPRANRAAELRAAKMAAAAAGPPTSFKSGGPTPTRRLSTSSLNDKPTTARASSSFSRPAAVTSASAPAPAPAAPATSAARPSAARAPPSAFSLAPGASTNGGGSSRASSSMGSAPIRRSSSALAAPMKKPDIEPRTNRSALLRERAKLEAQKATGRAF